MQRHFWDDGRLASQLVSAFEGLLSSVGGAAAVVELDDPVAELLLGLYRVKRAACQGGNELLAFASPASRSPAAPTGASGGPGCS